MLEDELQKLSEFLLSTQDTSKNIIFVCGEHGINSLQNLSNLPREAVLSVHKWFPGIEAVKDKISFLAIPGSEYDENNSVLTSFRNSNKLILNTTVPHNSTKQSIANAGENLPAELKELVAKREKTMIVMLAGHAPDQNRKNHYDTVEEAIAHVRFIDKEVREKGYTKIAATNGPRTGAKLFDSEKEAEVEIPDAHTDHNKLDKISEAFVNNLQEQGIVRTLDEQTFMASAEEIEKPVRAEQNITHIFAASFFKQLYKEQKQSAYFIQK